MWRFRTNVVTLKNDNRIGDLVGVVLENEAGGQKGYSLDELLGMVKREETRGFKLISYISTNQEGMELDRGQLVFFDDDRPLLMDNITYHRDISDNEDISFSEALQQAILTSPYV